MGRAPPHSLAGALPTALGAGHPALASTAPAGTVAGGVSDAQGRPLPGATVLVRGTRQATSTNATGTYALNVPAGAVLQFGYGGALTNFFLTPAPAA